MEDNQTSDNKKQADQGMQPSPLPAEGKDEYQVAERHETTASAERANRAYLAWQSICKQPSKFWGFVKAPESTNIAIAIATIVISIATVYTYSEIHSGSAQTDKIIAADERIATAMENAVSQSHAALDASIESSRLDRRAWIGVEDISLLNQMGGHLPYLTVQIKSRNAGLSPALNVANQLAVAIASSFESALPTMGALPPGHIGTPALPGQTRTQIEIGPSPSPDDFLDMLNGRKTLFIYGRITYQDIFGRSHETKFCGFYNIKKDGLIDACPNGFGSMN